MNPGTMEDVQVSGIRIPEVSVQLPCCERVHYRNAVCSVGCWVFCLWDIFKLRVPPEYVPESQPKSLSDLEGEQLRG
jgi:hypothetical protein